ncbi:MAG: hypothetical protein ABJK64_10240 [Paraglaciecola sp.]|uniref:hypothetical protein n=1 Tax=Paraglaciecola sp. TaxID=1920173 RepID=UPI003299025C
MNKMHPNKMDDEYITQNDIIHKYLHNKLTPEEVMAFEEYIMDKPHLLEQLELDSVMVETMPNVKDPPKKRFLWGTSMLPSFLSGAACIAVVSVFFLSQTDSSQNYPSPNIVYLENYRSANTSTQINSYNSTSSLFVVDTSDFAEDKFDVMLQLPDGSKHTLATELLINESNEVIFSIKDNSLLRTDSIIIVSPSNRAQAPLSFPITLNTKG